MIQSSHHGSKEREMIKRLNFNAKFSDIGLMPVSVNTYRDDIKKAISDYIKRMKDIGVEVLETRDARFV
jgi:hypothetical protein